MMLKKTERNHPTLEKKVPKVLKGVEIHVFR